MPLPGHEVAVHIKNFCMDLEERLRHLRGAESIAELLAWADWRFQWIHPFKDFNGRTGRILLIALAYKLSLPPIDPASDESGKAVYFGALCAADVGNLVPLTMGERHRHLATYSPLTSENHFFYSLVQSRRPSSCR